MSNDIYQQRQFFEESGPFPDFKDVVYEMPSGNVFIGTTLKLNKDEIKRIVIKETSIEELLKIPYDDLCPKDQAAVRLHYQKQRNSPFFKD